MLKGARSFVRRCHLCRISFQKFVEAFRTYFPSLPRTPPTCRRSDVEKRKQVRIKHIPTLTFGWHRLHLTNFLFPKSERFVSSGVNRSSPPSAAGGVIFMTLSASCGMMYTHPSLSLTAPRYFAFFIPFRSGPTRDVESSFGSMRRIKSASWGA